MYLEINAVKFGDTLRYVGQPDCLRRDRDYIVYRTPLTARLYVCCVGPHYDEPKNPEEKKLKQHVRHYLDQMMDEAKTQYIGWEKVASAPDDHLMKQLAKRPAIF